MQQMVFGFKQEDITPRGECVWADGFGFRTAPVSAIRDRLYAQAAYFALADSRFAIVSLDVCGLTEQVYNILALHIKKLSGLLEDEFALCATHTHSGPSCGLLFGVPVNLDYWHRVGETIGGMLKQAMLSALPAEIGGGQCDGELIYSENRRGRPHISRKISVLAAASSQTELAIALTACHPVIFRGNELSADFVGSFRSAMRGTGMFLQGCSGDIRPSFPKSIKNDEKADLLGGYIARQVEQLLGTLGKKNQNTLKHLSITAEVPMRPYPSKQTLAARLDAALLEYYAETDWDKRHMLLQKTVWLNELTHRLDKGASPNILADIKLLLIGDSIFVFLPFEALTVTGQAVERRIERLGISKNNIFVVSCCGITHGYLAPREEIPFRGYEIEESAMWIGTAGCSEKSEEAVLKAVYSAAEQLISGRGL